MGISPKSRVNRPLLCFENTGVDYAWLIFMVFLVPSGNLRYRLFGKIDKQILGK